MNENLKKFYSEQSKEFLKFLGVPENYKTPIKIKKKINNPNKLLAMFDPHEPYTIDDLFEWAYRSDGDAENIFIGGDLGDFYSKSRFGKKHNVGLKDEMRAIFYRMEWLSIRFNKVYILKGNHDDRPEKKIRSLFNDGEVDLQILTESDVLGRLASYFDNIEIVGTRVYNHTHDINLSHIWQRGDIIFTHAELSRKQDTAVMEYISNYLHRWKTTLKLKPYSVIFQAHNHRMSKTIKGDELWMLAPCAMETISIGSEYIYHPKCVGDPPVRGYSIIYQENGKTDWNKTNSYIYQ